MHIFSVLVFNSEVLDEFLVSLESSFVTSEPPLVTIVNVLIVPISEFLVAASVVDYSSFSDSDPKSS